MDIVIAERSKQRADIIFKNLSKYTSLQLLIDFDFYYSLLEKSEMLGNTMLE